VTEITYLGAFLGGFLSFLSPCILPLIPSYVSYITGISLVEFRSGNKALIRKLTIINSISFVIGFSSVFILLGISASLIGYILSAYYDVIRIVGGIIIILFGLYIMGVFKIKALSRERKIHLHIKPSGYLGSLVVGLTFGAGWTPCIGPILGSILLYAGTSGSAGYGFKLLLMYSLGLGIPFLITALTINTFLSHFSSIQRHMRLIMILSGLLLIAFGIILLTDSALVLMRLIPNLTLKAWIHPYFSS